MCFAFFFFYAMALSVVQSFAPEAARQLHAVPLQWVAACLTIYMVGSASGMVVGGFLATDPTRCERIVGVGMALAACIALTVALSPMPGWMVPVAFGAMGLVTGSASPSRDMLVKRSTPANASGRVFGVVYSGLDIGQALAPLLFGRLMDLHHYSAVWVGLALVQLVLIASAFKVQRVRRERAPA
jgi:MFS family permease